MDINYKEPEYFKDISSKNILKGEIVFGSSIECEEDLLDNDISYDFESQILCRWEEMMNEGISPLMEIQFQYQSEIPIFDPRFLNSITNFLRNYPKKGSKILNYILEGPLINIITFDWGSIYEILLQYLPYSINTISHTLFIEESPNFHHKLIFLEMGGLSMLYQYEKDESYHLDLALILKYLSSYKLSDYNFIQSLQAIYQDDIYIGSDSNDCITNFVNKSSSSGIQTKIGIDIETEEDFESAFCQFCESLLSSEEFDVRMNTLDALLSLTENDISIRDVISRISLSHIDLIQNYEEIIIVLKILANSLTINSYIMPFISHLSKINNTFLETTDSQFDDAFCAFLENIFHGKDSDEICLFGIVDKIADIITTDLPFENKRNVLIILIKIADSCNLSTFETIMSEELIICLIDFLNMDDKEIINGILRIFRKLVDNWEELGIPSDFFDIISSERDTFMDLQDSDDMETINLSSYILSIINYYPDATQF